MGLTLPYSVGFLGFNNMNIWDMLRLTSSPDCTLKVWVKTRRWEQRPWVSGCWSTQVSLIWGQPIQTTVWELQGARMGVTHDYKHFTITRCKTLSSTDHHKRSYIAPGARRIKYIPARILGVMLSTVRELVLMVTAANVWQQWTINSWRATVWDRLRQVQWLNQQISANWGFP